MNKSVGVIGCGWLGLPLAKSLSAKGYYVNGTTTSTEKLKLLENNGISPYRISISEDEINGPISKFLTNSPLLIVNIPPGLRGKGRKESYVKKMQLLHNEIKKASVKRLIFVSSTSVYGAVSGEITEKTVPQPSTESGKQLLVCEQLFTKDPDLETTVVRFGGLIGPDRHPVTILSGRENLSDGNAPVNLIHLNDCIGIINAIIKGNQWGEILNGVYPDHPTKKEYYTSEALKRDLKPPIYLPAEGKEYKKITSSNPFLIKKYVFLTPISS